MKIKYSKFDFNIKDIYFFTFFFVGSIDLENFLSLSIFLAYLIYRFYLVLKLKKKMTIEIEDKKIRIANSIYRKEINFNDIKMLNIRKNMLSSYDIMINFDETISMFRYFCNYFSDISIGKNHLKSYVICDVKNKDEILKKILDKLKINEETKKVKKEKLYIKYSLFEINFCFFLGILFLLLLIETTLKAKLFILVYLVFINLKILKKEYEYVRINKDKIKIERKGQVVYLLENFSEDIKNLKIDYEVKHILSKYNFYYFFYNVLPVNYKKY